jgi:hypothetical protein
MGFSKGLICLAAVKQFKPSRGDRDVFSDKGLADALNDWEGVESDMGDCSKY